MIDGPLGWGARWAFGEPRPRELDPLVLLWWMRRRVHRDRLPPRRVVVEFEFRGVRSGAYWLILTRSDVSVCLQHPRFDVTYESARTSRASTTCGSDVGR